MEIQIINTNKRIEHILREGRSNSLFINSILNQVFNICKLDKNFSIREKIDEIDKQIEDLNIKKLQQEDLINKGIQAEKELSSRIKELKLEVPKLREKLTGELCK